MLNKSYSQKGKEKNYLRKLLIGFAKYEIKQELLGIDPPDIKGGNLKVKRRY